MAAVVPSYKGLVFGGDHQSLCGLYHRFPLRFRESRVNGHEGTRIKIASAGVSRHGFRVLPARGEHQPVCGGRGLITGAPVGDPLILIRHTSEVHAMAAVPDLHEPTLLATGDDTGMVRLWDRSPKRNWSG
jgi:hypothetical protein